MQLPGPCTSALVSERFAPTNRNVAKTCSYGQHTIAEAHMLTYTSTLILPFGIFRNRFSDFHQNRAQLRVGFSELRDVHTNIFLFFFLFRTHAQERETCAHKHTLRMLCVQCVVYMIFLLCLCANAELLRSTPKLLCKGSLHAWHGME